jgi:DNA polymerase-3 subunit delta
MPKLRPEQLANHLTKNLAPLYLLGGEEPLIIQELGDQIRASARTQGFTERELYHVDAQFDWGQLLAAANSMSLFAERKIIELRLSSSKIGDKGSKALQEYCKSPAADNLLLIVANKLESDAQRSKWFKAIEACGQVVQVWPINTSQLPGWIQQRLQRTGLTADSDAIELLAARIEGNLLAAAQEIEKLKLLAPNNHINLELMASVVADSARYNVFGLSDKALHGDARAAVKTLQGLRTEGTDAIAILWAVTRDIRALLQIAEAMQQGKAFEWAAKQAGIRDKRFALIQGALRRHKGGQLQQLLRKANGIDKAIKGMRNAEPWDELLDLILNIAGVHSLNPLNDRLNIKL